MIDKILVSIPFSKRWFLSWTNIIVGSLLVAAAFVFFMTPYHIIPGGVYGIGIILNDFFPQVEVGTFGLCMDIPLLLTAFRLFGARFGAKTIVAAVLTPVFMNLLTWTVGDDPATMLGGRIDLSNDVLLSAIFGGLVLGAGLGLIFKTHATSGGTDIIAMIVSKYVHLPISRAVLYVDSCVVLLGLVVFGDWRLPLYSIITLFIVSKVIDSLVEGVSTDKIIFIISEKHEQLRRFIIEDLDRGGTYIKSTGLYTKASKEMIFLVVSRREVSLVKEGIREVDPDVFMAVVDAYEVLGDGFKTIHEKLG